MGMFQKICKRTLVMAIFAGVACATDAAAASDQPSLVEWNFSNGENGGWRYGGSKTPDATISPAITVVPGLGMRLALNFHDSEWGDANLKTQWNVPQAAGALKVRLLIPVSEGKPKGQIQLGCAMNAPSSVENQSKKWTEMYFHEVVTISGDEYRAESVTCDLGTSLKGPVLRELVIRLGGQNVRYKGVLYIQQIRALRIPGAPPLAPIETEPVVSTPVRIEPVVIKPVISAPVISAPVISAPVISAPVISAPVISAPVIRAPVISAPVKRAAPVAITPSRKTQDKQSAGIKSPSNTPVIDTPVSNTPVIDTPVSNTPVIDTPVSKPEPVIVEQVRARRNVD